MSSSNRRPFQTATALTQKVLDDSQDNLVNEVRLIVEIDTDQRLNRRAIVQSFIIILGNLVINSVDHRLVDKQGFIFESTGTLPPEFTAGVTYYCRDPAADVMNVSETPSGPLISTLGAHSGVHSISATPGIIRASDRTIYVGPRYYDSRTQFPVITRTVGEWLAPAVQFSVLNLDLANVIGDFNQILPGGEYYSGQINRELQVKLGLRELENSYFPIFAGVVSEVGGVKRDIKKIKFVARDNFDRLNTDFPITFYDQNLLPKLRNSDHGNGIPVIWGDYNTETDPEGNIPVQITNNADPQLDTDKERPVQITVGAPGIIQLDDHRLDDNDEIEFVTTGGLPSPLSTGTTYYVLLIDGNTFMVEASIGGGPLALTDPQTGNHSIKTKVRVNIQCQISENALTFFDNKAVWLLRSSLVYLIHEDDIVNIAGGLNGFEIVQDSGFTLLDGENFKWQESDIFLVRVQGPTLAGYRDNPVEQAKNLLKTYVGLTDSDFDANWATYRDKAAPAQSAIASLKSRIWVQKGQSVLQYALSLLEQCRLEMFVSRDLKLKLYANHLEDWEPDPAHIVRNFDVEKDSLKVTIDEKTNFNRAKAVFDFHPYRNQNDRGTAVYRNQAAIDQISGKEISKLIEFPNLYIEAQAIQQLEEILKIASGYLEIVSCNLTLRALLLDVGDFVKMNVSIGATVWESTPMKIRQIGISPDMKLPVNLWSLQMIPFANPGGWDPGYSGIVGGDTAVITREV